MKRRYNNKSNNRSYKRGGYRGRGKKRYGNNRDKVDYRAVNTPTGIPDAQMIKMKYVTFVNLNPVGASTDYVFRGNSIFDPDYAMGGTQPLGHDQWAAFYERYLVRASAIKIQVLNNSTTYTGNTLINLTASEDVVSRTYDEWAAYPYNTNQVLAPVSAGGNGVFLESYMSTRKIFGCTRELDDVYEAPMGNNPSKQWYWTIQVAAMNGITAPNLTMKVEMTYYVELSERVELLAS